MPIKPFLLLQCVVATFLISCEANKGGIASHPTPVATTHSILSLTQKTNSLTGDFNGDGKTDTITVVKTAEMPSETLAGAKTHAAWPYYGKGKRPGVKDGGPLLLLIAETGKDCQVIYDPNKISVLATNASKGMFVVTRQDRANTAWEDVGDAAKGDIVVIPTEAGIDSYLIWDGSAYISLEIKEIP